MYKIYISDKSIMTTEITENSLLVLIDIVIQYCTTNNLTIEKVTVRDEESKELTKAIKYYIKKQKNI